MSTEDHKFEEGMRRLKRALRLAWLGEYRRPEGNRKEEER
mgnify:CR=1 FL=1